MQTADLSQVGCLHYIFTFPQQRATLRATEGQLAC